MNITIKNISRIGCICLAVWFWHWKIQALQPFKDIIKFDMSTAAYRLYLKDLNNDVNYEKGLTIVHFLLKKNNSEKIQSLLSGINNNEEIKQKLFLTPTTDEAEDLRGLPPLHFSLVVIKNQNQLENVIKKIFEDWTTDNELKKKIFLQKGEVGVAQGLDALQFAQKLKDEDKIDEKIVNYLQKEYEILFPSQLTMIQNLLTLLKKKLIELLHAIKALQE